MESYVDRSAIDEVVKVFKLYAEKSIEKSASIAADTVNSKKKKKVNLLSVDEEEDKKMAMAGFAKDDKMFLQLTFKFPSPNRTTYINNYRPLPHPYHNLVDATICMIVPDRNHKPLADRDFDLRMTREYYQKRLLNAGIPEDIIKHRLVILPMRELLTEYRLPQMKRRLSVSYDVIMADTRLIKNRFKLLPKFLGHKFWIENKNVPIGVALKYTGKNLKDSFYRALRTCTLYVTGHGPDSSVQFGVFKQSEKELSDNLEFLCQSICKTYGKTVQILKIKSTRSLAIPFYADLSRPTAEIKALIPRTPRLDSKPIKDDHPFCENAELIVYPSGKVDMKRPEGWTPGSDDEDEDQYEDSKQDERDQDERRRSRGFGLGNPNERRRFRKKFNSKSELNGQTNGQSNDKSNKSNGKSDGESKFKKLKV